MKPRVKAYIVCYFDENTAVENISKNVKIRPTALGNTDRTAKNEKVKIENGFGFNAFWEYSTAEIQTYDINDALLCLFNDITNHVSEIALMLKENAGNAKIVIVIYSTKRDKCALYLGHEIVQLASTLHASFDIDLYE